MCTHCCCWCGITGKLLGRTSNDDWCTYVSLHAPIAGLMHTHNILRFDGLDWAWAHLQQLPWFLLVCWKLKQCLLRLRLSHNNYEVYATSICCWKWQKRRVMERESWEDTEQEQERICVDSKLWLLLLIAAAAQCSLTLTPTREREDT